MVCGGRDQANPVKASGQGRMTKLFIFFRGQIYDNESIDTRRIGIIHKLLASIAIDRVEVAHQDNGSLGVF